MRGAWRHGACPPPGSCVVGGMNVRRYLAAAAAGTALAAVIAPSAHAFDLGGTLSGAARTTSAAGAQIKPAANSVVGDKVGQKVTAVKDGVKAGGEAVKAANDAVKAGHALVG
ncbi:hypothetical protein GCM10010331_32620 [Streptomyces xanthochromogenes]|uniref:ATP-binding protein n=2 Tax=Streptomyces TaxID=1883 RepID=A0ABQ3A0T6_9ACTN|nr:hypothetical protein GCM10010326_23090 [Streptomyces xanthochromogenes]GHB42680.1 hypothetical protein GCM10010331_32620 [Streptomyces xanthochromogenes]